MRHLRTLICLLFFSCLGLSRAFAQDISTQGTEFWVSFLGNGYKTNVGFFENPWVINQVLISGKRDCSGIIENPNTGWSQTFTVNANTITTIDNLESQSYVETSDYERIVNKGLRIVTTDTVSVYCTNIANVSFDASYVLPIQALADDYIIQTYDQSTSYGWTNDIAPYLTSAFLIVATEDNTIIDITPTVNSFSGAYPAHEEFSITLNKGEVYQFRSTKNDNHRDLSGTRVTARDCKKIAVFNGNTLTAIPDSRESRDIVFEQAMPLQAWGKNFVVTTSFGRDEDYMKITSSSDNNAIYKNGELLTTLNSCESQTFLLGDDEASCFIESSYPAAVFLYNTSFDSYSDDTGDPSMVWIAPIEQRIDEITFTTFHDSNHADIDHHYINIIVNTEDITSVYLDGEQISPLLFYHVNGTDNYRYAQLEILHGTHQISCAHGFNAHVYGFGYAKGYAYLVGSKASNLITTLYINDQIVQPNDVIPFCTEEPVTFAADINFQSYELEWDFDDGTTSTQNPVEHVYHEKRVFRPTLVVNTEAIGCTSSDSDTTSFYVDLTQKYAPDVHDGRCVGTYYSGYGLNDILITEDVLLLGELPNPDNPYCPDSVRIYITAWPQVHKNITDSRCWTGQPATYNENGFNFVYDHPDTYVETIELQNANGCDSIVTLTLEVSDFIHIEPEIVYRCFDDETPQAFLWDKDGQIYTNDTIVVKALPYGDCYGEFTLNLNFLEKPEIEHIYETTCHEYYWSLTGQTYNTDGTYSYYEDLLPYDCQKETQLHLDISGSVEGETTTATDCDSHLWLGTTYTLSGFYSDTLLTLLGCDSIVYLDLDMEYTPEPTDIFPKDPDNTAPHWVITATEFQINSYDFTFRDKNDLCVWDSVSWSIENPEVKWVLEPDTMTTPIGRNCKIYVLNHVNDTVWLSAKAYNKCEPLGIERRYWFICSFYDIEEDTSTDFSIVPNPNNGKMRLEFENLNGKIDVKVYDMKGILIDEIQTISDTNTVLTYDMPSCTEGIYFFVVTSNKGMMTKKVIIRK